MKLPANWKESWLTWLLLLLLMRLAFGIVTAPPDSSQTKLWEPLLPVALHDSSQAARRLAWESVTDIIARWPGEREKIVARLSQEQARTANAEITQFLWQLQHDPDVVLTQMIAAFKFPWLDYAIPICLGLTGFLGLILLLGIPGLLGVLGGKRGMRKVFGRFGWQQMVLLNGLVWLPLPWLLGTNGMIWLHLVVVAGIALVFWRLAKSHTLVILTGATDRQIGKIAVITSVLLLCGWLIRWWPVTTPTAEIPLPQLIATIDHAAAHGPKRVVPLLVTLLRRPLPYPQAADRVDAQVHILKALGALGSDSDLEQLLPLVRHADPTIQAAALAAIKAILQRNASNGKAEK